MKQRLVANIRNNTYAFKMSWDYFLRHSKYQHVKLNDITDISSITKAASSHHCICKIFFSISNAASGASDGICKNHTIMHKYPRL